MVGFRHACVLKNQARLLPYVRMERKINRPRRRPPAAPPELGELEAAEAAEAAEATGEPVAVEVEVEETEDPMRYLV
jgi:hypothetical protein